MVCENICTSIIHQNNVVYRGTDNPADVTQCWSALLMCVGCGCCHCSCCWQLFLKRLQLKENIWEHEIFEVTWHYCWVTRGLSTCKEVQIRKNFLTKRWPFFFFFDPIDVRFLSQALYSIVTCARERVHYRLLALMQTMKLSNRLPIALTQKLEKNVSHPKALFPISLQHRSCQIWPLNCLPLIKGGSQRKRNSLPS